MRYMIAVAAALFLSACGERMDMQAEGSNITVPEPSADIASNAAAVADYARREISAIAPEIENPGRTLNGRICAAAMARVAKTNESAIKLESVDGNTTRLIVGKSQRECLVDRDIVIWREVSTTQSPTSWRQDDNLRYRISDKGQIEILTGGA